MASFSTARVGVWEAKHRPLLPKEREVKDYSTDRKGTKRGGIRREEEEGERKGKVQVGPGWKKFRMDCVVGRVGFHLVCFRIFWVPLVSLDTWVLFGGGSE